MNILYDHINLTISTFIETEQIEVLEGIHEKFIPVDVKTLDSKNRISPGEKILKMPSKENVFKRSRVKPWTAAASGSKSPLLTKRRIASTEERSIPDGQLMAKRLGLQPCLAGQPASYIWVNLLDYR